MNARRRHDRLPQLFKSNHGNCCLRITFNQLNCPHKTVSASYHCLQISRLRGVVFQGNADLADSGIDSLLDVDENISAPKLIRDLLTCYQLAMPVHKADQQAQRKTFHAQRLPVAAQLESSEVEFKLIKADYFLRHASCSCGAKILLRLTLVKETQ